MKKNHQKLISIMLITGLLIMGCGAAKSDPAPVKEEAQTQVTETPVTTEEPEAVASEAEEQAVETQEAAEAETQDMSASKPSDEQQETQGTENVPAEDNTKTLEVVDEKESELEDGTKCTETTYSDGSVKLIKEKNGIKTETNYDTNLYPQSKVVYDEEGNKKSETTFKYDENEPEKSWESSIEYDENGNVLYTSETENVYPQEEGYKYGAGPASGPDKLYPNPTGEGLKYGPDKLYPNPTGEGLKYGTELLPSTSETIVKDAQGGFVIQTISIDNEERKATVEYLDGIREKHYPIISIGRDGTSGEAMQIDYFEPYNDAPFKQVTLFQSGKIRVVGYENGSRVVHEYDKDGNQIK